ncbi:Nn.00g098470.m01.CDS01 [Neocucurbitaria sp. VM-36]
MTTLAANDQENAVRHLHAGAAGKSLNAGLKGFNAKTPGNKAPKTPFKVPLNDENAVNKAGKSVLKTNGKGNENLLMTSKKGGKLDDNAFVTPAGPRTRAPLGMKTTNAKSKAFQTPAPLSSAKTQKVSPRLRRPKVKVHQPEVDLELEDGVPEVEYMPPKEIPLEDDMDDYLPKDWNFPKIDHESMTRGIWEAYHNPIEDDGRTRNQRKFEEELERERKKRDEEFENVFEAQMAKDDAEARWYLGIEEPKAAPKQSTVPKRAATGVSTMNARMAASALSPVSKPSYAAPTAAAKSRLPTGLISSKKSTRPLAEPTAARQASAAAASKSTIGYAQGRAGRTGLAARKPLSNVTKPAPFSATTRRAPSAPPPHNQSTVRSRSAFSRSNSTATDATLVTPQQDEQTYRTAEEIEREMEMLMLSREVEDDEDDAWTNSFNAQLHGDPLDEELEDFQFQLPEGF